MAWYSHCVGLLCIVLWLHSAYSSDCSNPLGMESHDIPCSAITASSERNAWHRASKARLSSRPYYRLQAWMCSGWSPSSYDVKPWLQIDLRYSHVIIGVATQGGRARAAWNWVTGYKISYSMDGKTWRFYETAGEATKIFSGNRNYHEIVRNDIKPPLTAIYVRISPVTWKGVPSLRVELYGCVDVDECQTSPCKNGGTCKDLAQDYTCSCRPGSTGKNCEINFEDACYSSPCQNGGICSDLVNGYTCSCRPGSTGKNCEISIGVCASFSPTPCLHDGVCVDTINSYSCVCRPGFVGKHCEKNIDECESKPCRNGGTCTDMINDFRCACRPDWTGKACTRSLGPSCTCVNGAVCTDTVNGFRCICRPGFTGKNCEKNDPFFTILKTKGIVQVVEGQGNIHE